MHRLLKLLLATTMAITPLMEGQVANGPQIPGNRNQDEQGSVVTHNDGDAVLPPVVSVAAKFEVPIERIRIDRVLIDGIPLLSDKEIAEISAPYLGHDVTIEQLYALRRELSAAYVRRGYINSGVILPDQKISNSTVVMKEIRGSLTGIEVSGNRRLSRNYVLGRVKQDPGEPLQIDKLQASLELLRQDPLISKINAHLQPGIRPGESELDIAIRRAPTYQIGVGADNFNSASTGGERGTLLFSDINLTGHGDSLRLDLGMSGGRGIGFAAYAFPLNAHRTALTAEFALDHARIIESPFDQIDIQSRTSRAALFLRHPWVLHTDRSLTTYVGMERRHSESTLLGVPFSFSAGDHDGKSSTTTINVGVEYSARRANDLLAMRGLLRRGVDLFKATVNEGLPDGMFTVFIGQAQYARRIGPRKGELLLRWTSQLSANPLLSLEKIPIGGFNTVRGYRENLFVRDNGLAASAEWRLPLNRPRVGATFSPMNLQIAPFVDFGRSWDLKTAISDSKAELIYSGGVGCLWNPTPAFYAQIYWGHRFRDVQQPNNDLQDKGIHFALQYVYSF